MPSSTKHQHHSTTIAPVAPEANLCLVLKWSTACSLTKSSCLKLAAILNTAISQADIACPNCTILEPTVTFDFLPECLFPQTVTRGLQQCSMMRVITVRDLEFQTTHQPECWREHVCVYWWAYFFCIAYTLVTVLPSSFPIFDSSLLADFSCRYKSRLKGTRESFSLELQGRETNLWKYDETIRSALFNVWSGPYFVTWSSSIWLSSSPFIFTDTRSSDVVLTFLFEIHQILRQPTTLSKSIGTVHGRWLHTQPLLRPKLRNPASPYPYQSWWKSWKTKDNNNENSIVPSSFLTTSDLFFRIASFSFNITRRRGVICTGY